MKFNIYYIFFFIFLFSCVQEINKSSKVIENSFSSRGFALIYDESLSEKKFLKYKLSNNQNYVLHNFLKANRLINISNPINSKSITAKVKNTDEYPSIYNIVITKNNSYLRRL